MVKFDSTYYAYSTNDGHGNVPVATAGTLTGAWTRRADRRYLLYFADRPVHQGVPPAADHRVAGLGRAGARRCGRGARGGRRPHRVPRLDRQLLRPGACTWRRWAGPAGIPSCGPAACDTRPSAVGSATARYVPPRTRRRGRWWRTSTRGQLGRRHRLRAPVRRVPRPRHLRRPSLRRVPSRSCTFGPQFAAYAASAGAESARSRAALPAFDGRRAGWRTRGRQRRQSDVDRDRRPARAEAGPVVRAPRQEPAHPTVRLPTPSTVSTKVSRDSPPYQSVRRPTWVMPSRRATAIDAALPGPTTA
ncbi:hypothetical protein GA0070608_0486 [Micromonospora peucetia]|uniref:Glycosyl hydrolases family 43 n=1 Tax=Micromonospora peucetia TaxID=47871 RepID=A0A1C6U588_9ACTN|nr:hypothetical protein GA0070608_0486 [Micromonospora peucetia]